eukprot:GHVL01010985.1.p1 GENE.GHVL01010985.1~~GHVL01010985.1.p1  ORF type:complete len:436 (+),score=122.72 GHVL01010985.1:50-1357(+)
MVSCSNGNLPPITQDGGSKSLQCRVARKKVEQDALLLANRISLLRAEERKAIKRIEETKRRAYEVMEVRRRNENRELEKQHLKQRELEHQEQLRLANIEKKNEAQRKFDEQMRETMINKIHNVQQHRESRKYLEKQLNECYGDTVQQAAQRKEESRRREQEAIQKRRCYMAKKKAMAKQNFDEKLRKEIQIHNNKEAEISSMENEELNLIARLQYTQQQQRDAYCELEEALRPKPRSTVRPRVGANTGSVTARSSNCRSQAPPSSSSKSVSPSRNMNNFGGLDKLHSSNISQGRVESKNIMSRDGVESKNIMSRGRDENKIYRNRGGLDALAAAAAAHAEASDCIDPTTGICREETNDSLMTEFTPNHDELQQADKLSDGAVEGVLMDGYVEENEVWEGTDGEINEKSSEVREEEVSEGEEYDDEIFELAEELNK